VQGVSVGRNLGQMDQAEQNLRIADGLIQSVLVSQPANRTALLRAAQIAHDRMILASLQGGRRDVAHRPEVLVLARKSVESLDKFNAGKTDKPEELQEVLTIYMNVADQTMQARHFDEALRICSRAGDLASSLDDRVSLAMFRWVTAEVFQQRADLDEALKAIRESVQLLDVGAGNSDVTHTMNLVHVLIWEGRILGQDNGVSLGRSEEASASFERAFRITDEVVHQDSKDQNSRARLGMAGLGLADILRQSDPRQALAAYDHTLRHLAEIGDNSVIRRLEVDALAGSSYPLRRLGRSADARQRLDAAFERLNQLKLYPAERVTPGSVTFKSLRALADLEADNGNISRAIETYQKLLEQIRAAKLEPETFLEDALDQSNIYRAMADLHLRNGQAAQAQTMSALRLELWRTWDRQLPQNPFIRRQLEAASSR
jgi:tetratricopeptide (TPR) repeat protein